MCSMSVLCPLCAQSSFASIDALRVSLIRAANGPLACPICHEMFLGLDKLTIHLFSHTNILTSPADATGSSVAALRGEHVDSMEVSKRDKNNQKLPQFSAAPEAFKNEPEPRVQHAILSDSQSNQAAPTPPHTTLPTCDICEFSFRNRELLEMHYRLVHQNPGHAGAESQPPSGGAKPGHDFKCHLCPKTFKMKGSLRVHLKVVHLIGIPSGSNPPKLNICERIRHKEVEVGGETETQVATGAASQPMANSNAGANVHSAQGLRFVLSTASGPLLSTQASSFAPQSTSGDRGELGTNVRNFNGAVMSLEAAANTVHLPPNVLLVLSTSVTPNGSTNAASTTPPMAESEKEPASKASTESSAKIWECDVCSKSFTTKYFLKKHKRLHTGEMPYTCEICSRTFTFQQSYHKHLLYHSDEKPHVCATCGRAFKELSTLHNHERIHSGEKPFKCEVCEKSFRQRVSFLVHTRIHTGVMPYKCEVCQKSFRYKVSQRTHKCLPKSPEAPSPAGNADTVDHISESFIKAFLESNATSMEESQNSPHSAEIAAITGNKSAEFADSLDAKNAMDEAMLSKTIDDIVVESCHKLGIGVSPLMDQQQQQSQQHLSPPPSANGLGGGGNDRKPADGTHSPMLKLQNMRLYSPEMMQQSLCEDAGDFPHFLLDDVGPQIM